jgi:predicted RNA-binding Zn ribbon-like protein
VTEFPILGTEPTAVEFANTRYGGGFGIAPVDYLRTARLVDQWFAAVGRPGRHTAEDAARGRELRDHVHVLFAAAATGAVPSPDAVAGVNAFAAAASPALALTWAADGTRRATLVDAGTGVTAVLARLATDAVELLATGTLVTCAGCTMFFVRTHARRRWCHPTCGHRDRQARYYRRHRSHP